MNVLPEVKSLEIGGIFFGKKMQKTNLSTESIFLLMHYAFIKWRCNNLNEASRYFANRFGFEFKEELLDKVMLKGKRNTLVFILKK